MHALASDALDAVLPVVRRLEGLGARILQVQLEIDIDGYQPIVHLFSLSVPTDLRLRALVEPAHYINCRLYIAEMDGVQVRWLEDLNWNP